jgi:SAM-dependent methyltransferase
VGPKKVAADIDKSNGYEQVASVYIAGRGSNPSGIGVSVVADWCLRLPPAATVLDLGCGPGVPISQALIDHGFHVYAIDASPSMIAAFRARFPSVPVECAAVEDSDFFQRTFDAVVAWGLFFLLDAETQLRVIQKIARVLPRCGKLLFTAPRQICSWQDGMTGLTSISLGLDAYQKALEDEGMSLVKTHLGVGHNHYYFAEKR